MEIMKKDGNFYLKLIIVVAFMFGFRFIPPISVLTV